VLEIVHREKPDGVIVQFGGQTPLKLAVPLEKAGVKILGTSPDSIDRAEDRERFEEVLAKLDLRRPANGIARSTSEAIAVAERIGYPVLVRPSYVLGGRAMEIVYERADLERYMREAVRVSPAHPVLIDDFLEDAIEIDVDAVSDGATSSSAASWSTSNAPACIPETALAACRRRRLPPTCRTRFDVRPSRSPASSTSSD